MNIAKKTHAIVMEKKRAFDLRCLAKKEIHHKPPRDRPAGGGGGWWVSTNIHEGRLRPEVQPLTLLYTAFHENLCETGTPFAYLLLKLVPLSHTASLLTAVNTLSFK